MKKNLGTIPIVLMLSSILASCNGVNSSNNHAPIVLGDSATIVIEKDSQYVHDYVTDFHPNLPAASEALDTPAAEKPAATTTTTEPAATAAPAPTPAQQAAPVAPGKGLVIKFNELTISIPGIATKSYNNSQNANGASFQLISGTVNGNHIQITNGTVTKVSQRYQVAVILKNHMGTFPLNTLSETTDWAPIQGGNNVYTISGLEPNKLKMPAANAAEIREAVQKAARGRRLSKKKEQELLLSVRNTRSVNQAPLSAVLRSVIWKIEGKNAQGKPYQKQIRLDMPI